MRKPKVLFILHLPPPMHGAAMMGSYLKESSVINNEFDAEFVNLGTNKILNQSGKGSFKKLVTFGSILRKLTSTLSRQKYDLCYITMTAYGPGFFKDFFIVSIVKLWSKKIIYHFHNKGISSPKNIVTHLLYKSAFKNTKTILLSRYLYPDIQQYVKEKNVFYCPNGIPANNVYPVNNEAENKTNGSCCELLFLSNMMREKGIFVLLDSCRIMKENNVHFKCHFVGGWLNVSEEEFSKMIRDRNLTDAVFAHGPKYGKEKETFYKNAQVFVFPTFYDTFPLVCLEAMQNALAIVSTPEGGIPDIVIDGETGFLVPQYDADTLAEKLTLLIKNPALRSQMQIAGQERYENYFTLDKWERKISDILTEAIYEN